MARLSNLLLSAAALLALNAAAEPVTTEYLQSFGDSRYETVESTVIGREFHIFVRLPEGYGDSADMRYPTIYVLDGGSLFPLLASYYWYLDLGKEVPDAIVVGISYGSDTFEGGNYRGTDFTAPSVERDHWGGASNFQAFLSEELFPIIEKKYRSRPDRRVVFGHSLGGQFVLYTALTDPDLFWGHIASNPALHRNLSFFLERHSETNSESKLFVASGSMDDATFRGPALEWIEHWSRNEDRPWQLETRTLDGHTHFSAAPASFRSGMAWLFAVD